MNDNTLNQVREVTINYKSRRRFDKKIREPADCVDLLVRMLPNNSQEHFMAIYLDGSHSIIGYQVITTGLANMCNVHPREVFQSAIMLGSISIIVAHNHPSGELIPSSEDRKVTQELKAAGKMLGIPVLDHIIVNCEGSHYSFKESGAMFT